MAVWVQVPLAVQKTRIRKCSRFCCKALVKRLWGYVISTRGTKRENTHRIFSFVIQYSMFFVQPSHLLLPPRNKGDSVDNDEENVEYHIEVLCQFEIENKPNYTINYPVNPRIFLVEEQAVVGQYRCCHHTTRKKFYQHIIGKRIVFNHKSKQEIIGYYDQEKDYDCNKCLTFCHPHRCRFIAVLLFLPTQERSELNRHKEENIKAHQIVVT